ncbi:FadR/GntR family transcriptional regulator [Streptomyces chartreusis]|uniref:FadR family transcriptional regulator n=1 Tax=Streptomyces chartreusis TaxID=1969 RepID=A0A7H8T2B9_STRCX|nr:FadR/GntR family transcriptional regulator [Streptomyces chartreusis]QKZ17581.1 FadR family transcriptional regulator [Streptomyces chartreusis]
MADQKAPEQAPIAMVQQAAAYELTAEQLRRAVYSGRYLPGDRLPPERELTLQLGVSRTTLREAVRVLAAEKLVHVRRGAHGGIIVTDRPATSPEQLHDFLRRSAEQVDEILDLRIVLETGTARLAATRRSEEEVVTIQDAFDRMEEIFRHRRMDAVSAFWRADIEFHTRIATASGNTRLTRAVEDARIEFLRPLGNVFSTINEHAHDGHEAMLRAIRDRDPEAAEASVRTHIEVTRRVLREIAGLAPDARHAH